MRGARHSWVGRRPHALEGDAGGGACRPLWFDRGGGRSRGVGVWVGHRCPWLRHGCGRRGVVVRVFWSCVVTLRKSLSTWHTGWVCHVNVSWCDVVAFGCLSFTGGRSLLFVDGASLWWAGGRCAWGCWHRPSALWAGVRGVEKAISATWWWASLLSLVVPRLLGIRCGECRCRCGTPRWACHVSRLVVCCHGWCLDR